MMMCQFDYTIEFCRLEFDYKFDHKFYHKVITEKSGSLCFVKSCDDDIQGVLRCKLLQHIKIDGVLNRPIKISNILQVVEAQEIFCDTSKDEICGQCASCNDWYYENCTWYYFVKKEKNKLIYQEPCSLETFEIITSMYTEPLKIKCYYCKNLFYVETALDLNYHCNGCGDLFNSCDYCFGINGPRCHCVNCRKCGRPFDPDGKADNDKFCEKCVM